jgi:hypothetical protein
MPAVTIQQGPRNVELKRELIKKITDAFVETYRIPAETVTVSASAASSPPTGDTRLRACPRRKTTVVPAHRPGRVGWCPS